MATGNDYVDSLRETPEMEEIADEERLRKKLLDMIRAYRLPHDQMSELETFDDFDEIYTTASMWIQKAGHEVDEFNAKFNAILEGDDY